VDNQQVALASELDRRLAILQSEEAGDESHRALSSSELWMAFIIVAVTLIVGLVVSI
jgi:hypothetical protein